MQNPKVFNPLQYTDFRSDTATAPTPDIHAAMMKSSLGDDVYDEDESVKTLERYVATLCGHEAALYCASGTMTNQLAHRVHLSNPPQSAMVDVRSHVYNYEAGGISFLSQATVYPVTPANGRYLTVEDISSRIVLDVDVHYAPTRVISLENTLNGTIMPIKEIERIRALTQEHDIKLHLDGARLWHASIATGISMREYCSHFDTISLCLSKGIGAPIGSILVGSKALIKKARHFRLLFGGGWRQAGFLAEAALWCIKTNWPTMEDSHRQTRWLERAFRQVGCHITNPVDTNMIWVDTSEAGFTVEELMAELAKEKIKISGSGYAARVVLHYQISDEAVEMFIDVLRRLAISPRMKVSVDLTKASMREQPSSIYENEDNASSEISAPQTPRTPRRLTLVEPDKALRSELCDDISTPMPNKASFGEGETESRNSMDSPNFKQRCLFEEHCDEQHNSPSVDHTNRGSRRPFPNSFSSPSNLTFSGKSRPVSAFEPGTMKTSHLDGIDNSQETVAQYRSRFQEQNTPFIRRAQSLDLAETLEEQAAYEKAQEGRQQTADVKKVNKLQYRLSHNPASKALKRASVRISRWGSLLSREP
ncbi:Threonine aldolase [Entomortierella beljakovae]|nr:Threonine aldolase [Entomortierella beljakovae]